MLARVSVDAHGLMNATHSSVVSSFVVPIDHPALPGHFPGNPVVPGVIVLDRVIRSLQSSGAQPGQLRRLQQVKFLQPLLPGQEALITAAIGDAEISFSVTTAGGLIAKGLFESRKDSTHGG